MTVHLSTQSATVLERKASLHWAMLFIKAYRNPVACLSGQSTSRSSITISATPECCYLVMFGGDWLLLVQVVSKHLSFWVNTFLSCSCSHGDSGFRKQKHKRWTRHHIDLQNDVCDGLETLLLHDIGDSWHCLQSIKNYFNVHVQFCWVRLYQEHKD